MKRASLLAVLCSIVLSSSLAFAAEVQKSGPQVWPGKIQVGFHPLGGQISWNTSSVGGYKLVADIAGLIASPDKLSIWLGGGINYTAGLYYCYANNNTIASYGCGHDVQLWVFAMITFEKLITKFPLVPFARIGLGGDALVYSGDVGGAFMVRFGGGAHYYILKNIGLGFETNFTAGPGFGLANRGTFIYGTWDFNLGARFAF